MTNMHNSFRPATWLGCLIAIFLISALSGCTSTVKVNYVNWQIEFNKGISDIEKAKAVDSTQKYILNWVTQQEYMGWQFKRIIFSNTYNFDQDRAPIGVWVVFEIASIRGAAPPKPPGPGPGHPKLPNNIPNIHITDLGISH